MAAQYYLERHGQETGPYGFRDLIAFVREGQLVDSDLVRFGWTDKWQRADSLVGLFHMARRSPEDIARHDASSALVATIDPVDIEPPPGEILRSELDDRPGWMRRLLFVRGFRRKQAAEIPIVGPIAASLPAAASVSVADNAPTSELPALANTQTLAVPVQELPLELEVHFQLDKGTKSSAWSSAVSEALSAVERRRPSKRPPARNGHIFGIFTWLTRVVPLGEHSKELMRIGFRLVCAIVCAILVAMAVENWSAQYALRFPINESQQSAAWQFPIVGTCSSAEYLFLLFDLMLATGAAAWFAAGWMESHAE